MIYTRYSAKSLSNACSSARYILLQLISNILKVPTFLLDFATVVVFAARICAQTASRRIFPLSRSKFQLSVLKISDSREIDSNDLFQDLITCNRQLSCESRSSVRSTTYITRSNTSKSIRDSCYIVYTGYHLKNSYTTCDNPNKVLITFIVNIVCFYSHNCSRYAALCAFSERSRHQSYEEIFSSALEQNYYFIYLILSKL